LVKKIQKVGRRAMEKPLERVNPIHVGEKNKKGEGKVEGGHQHRGNCGHSQTREEGKRKNGLGHLREKHE